MLTRTQAGGFTLIDTMITLAIFSILAGVAVPQLRDVTGTLALGASLRDVERELQTARLKAVTSNRPMRVRFNCPEAGSFRMVELVGSPAQPDTADSANDRCSETKYPSPPADNNSLTRPNHDGPVRRLGKSISFGSTATLEFWPDGSVHKADGATNPWPVVPSTGTAITITKGTLVRTVTVNGIGKIQLQQ
jgi:type II secretory pathway pseudopilin PulG